MDSALSGVNASNDSPSCGFNALRSAPRCGWEMLRPLTRGGQGAPGEGLAFSSSAVAKIEQELCGAAPSSAARQAAGPRSRRQRRQNLLDRTGHADIDWVRRCRMRAVAVAFAVLVMAGCGGVTRHGTAHPTTHAVGLQKPPFPEYPPFPGWIAAATLGVASTSAACERTTSATWGCHLDYGGRILTATCRRLYAGTVECQGVDRQGESCNMSGTPESTYGITTCGLAADGSSRTTSP